MVGLDFLILSVLSITARYRLYYCLKHKFNIKQRQRSHYCAGACVVWSLFFVVLFALIKSCIVCNLDMHVAYDLSIILANR